MVQGYKGYDLDPEKQDTIEGVFSYARDTMTSPCAFHLITHICDAELFRATKSKGFIREFQRALKRQYKLLAKRKPKEGHAKVKRPQKCPNTLIVYSIEYKLTSQKEIDGNGDAYKYGYEATKDKLPFLHIHLHVIADCNNTIPENFTYHAMNAMNELDGLRATRYALTKPKKTKNKNGEYEAGKKYKKLNTDYHDAVLRAYYLAKIDQKSPEIPYRKTFDSSKVKDLSRAG